MSLLDENAVCDDVLIELTSEDGSDRITLPRLDFGNRENISTYKTLKFTKAGLVRQSYDKDMVPTDTVYSMKWSNLRTDKKREYEEFYVKYAGRPVWMKGADCVWRFGYILNSSMNITSLSDGTCGLSTTSNGIGSGN